MCLLKRVYQYVVGESPAHQSSPAGFPPLYSVACISSSEGQIPLGCNAFHLQHSVEVPELSLSENHLLHRGQKHALQNRKHLIRIRMLYNIGEESLGFD